MKSKIKDLIRPSILSIKAYSSARSTFKGQANVWLDANERAFGSYNRYPDPIQKALKEKLVKLKQVPLDTVFIGNGSDEVIDLVFRVFCEPNIDRVLIFTPTYGMYEVLAALNAVKVERCPLNEAFQIDLPQMLSVLKTSNVKLVFICSPNNPTGNLMSEHDIEYILEHFEGMVLIDEAYIDFSESVSWTRFLKKYPNLIILQTLSKAWGGAGLRIGMGFAHPEVIQVLNSVKSPYNISTVNQELALELLDKKDDQAIYLEAFFTLRTTLINALEQLKIVKKVYPTEANFILVKVTNAQGVYKHLIEAGIVVRNRHHLLEHCLRITVGTASENDILINALNQYNETEKSIIYRP